MSVIVKENPFTPEGMSDEISDYLPVGTVLYTETERAEELRLTEVRAEGKKKRHEKLLKRNATLVGQRNTTKKQLAECRALLTKLRDSGSWYWSAVELNIFEGVDGEALLAEIEALTGPRVQQ